MVTYHDGCRRLSKCHQLHNKRVVKADASQVQGQAKFAKSISVKSKLAREGTHLTDPTSTPLLLGLLFFIDLSIKHAVHDIHHQWSHTCHCVLGHYMLD